MNLTTRLFLWLEEKVKSGFVVDSLSIFLLFTVLLLPNMSESLTEMTGVTTSPDTSFLYSADELYTMAEEYGESGRAYYIMQKYTFDILWPVIYLLFFLVLLTCIYRSPGVRRFAYPVKLLPVYAFSFDILENIAASVVMYRYPQPTVVLAQATPLFTIAKWLLIGLSAFAVAAGLMSYLRRKLSEK